MLNQIIDVSHWNDIDAEITNEYNFKQIADFGIKAVISKATQGVLYDDPKYQIRQGEITACNMKHGAYHFGDSSDPVAQADHFLTVVSPDYKTLVALDFEPNGVYSMSLWKAELFVKEIFKQIGRWPVLYTGQYYLDRVGFKPNTNSPLENCPLWLAAYNDTPPVPKGWGGKLTIWQWSNGTNGTAFSPLRIPNHGAIDRDALMTDDLDTFWDWTPKTTLDKVETF